MSRTFAIGDIHGCSRAFDALLAMLDLSAQDTVISLGDYVARGPDTCGVLSRLVRLATECRLIPLLGNHDDALLAAVRGADVSNSWATRHGPGILASYPDAVKKLTDIPRQHAAFLEGCRLLYETPSHFFVHANYEASRPLDQQDRATLLQRSLRDVVPGAHASGKIAVVGHTPTPDGQVLDLGYLFDLDTGCCYGRWLTALELTSGHLFQTSQNGARRSGSIRLPPFVP